MFCSGPLFCHRSDTGRARARVHPRSRGREAFPLALTRGHRRQEAFPSTHPPSLPHPRSRAVIGGERPSLPHSLPSSLPHPRSSAVIGGDRPSLPPFSAVPVAFLPFPFPFPFPLISIECHERTVCLMKLIFYTQVSHGLLLLCTEFHQNRMKT